MTYAATKIIRDCPICGRPAVFNKNRLPDDKENPVYIKTRRRDIVLVHRSCYETTTYNYLEKEN